MNKSDSERIAAILEKKSYKLASTENEADLILVNMCSVRQSAVDRVFGLSQKLSQLKTKNPKLKTVLTGCILKEDKIKFSKKFDLILDIKNLADWPKILKENSEEILPEKDYSQGCYYLKIKPKYQNKFTAFIPISNGCNWKCSYCVVPFTRGKLVCRDHKEILEEVKEVIKKGYQEICLLGQNVNDYTSPSDPSIRFANLLELINDLPGDFQIRFEAPNPKNFSEELIEVIAKSEKVVKFLHLPVQSGDNEILKKMRRPYTVEQFKALVRKIREKIPEIKLSTDIIVGFPGETKEQFENTIKLMEEIKFDVAYIAKYSPRPGTAAFYLKDDVPWQEKKQRENILRSLLKNPK